MSAWFTSSEPTLPSCVSASGAVVPPWPMLLGLQVQSYSSPLCSWLRQDGLRPCCSSGSGAVVPPWLAVVRLQGQGYCSSLWRWLHLDRVHQALRFPLHSPSPLSLVVILRRYFCLLRLLLYRVVRSLLPAILFVLAFVVTRFSLSAICRLGSSQWILVDIRKPCALCFLLFGDSCHPLLIFFDLIFGLCATLILRCCLRPLYLLLFKVFRRLLPAVLFVLAVAVTRFPLSAIRWLGSSRWILGGTESSAPCRRRGPDR